MAVPAVARHDQPVAAQPIDRSRFAMRESGPLAFTPLEEQVIALALTDGLGSVEAPGRIERLFAKLFGLRATSRTLADPRLEALRRAVVVARHRHHMPDAHAAALRLSGYALAQIRMIEARAAAG
jgi:alkylhydroperoxidase family enzyme